MVPVDWVLMREAYPDREPKLPGRRGVDEIDWLVGGRAAVREYLINQVKLPAVRMAGKHARG